MRSTLIAGVFALLLPACIVGEDGITGAGGGQSGGGDMSGGGGGGGDGTGGGTGSGSGTQTTPRVEASVDKATVSTELGKTETLTLTVQSMNGFAGTVTIAPSVMDGTTAVTGWTLTPNPATVTLTDGSSQTVQLSVKVPTDTASLAPSVKVDLTSSAATATVSSAFTVAKQVTILIASGTGTGAPHTGLPSTNTPLRIRTGTKLVFHNADGIQHVIHGDGGIPHENTAAGQPNTDYTVTVSNDATWYCHDHEGSGTARPVLIVQ